MQTMGVVAVVLAGGVAVLAAAAPEAVVRTQAPAAQSKPAESVPAPSSVPSLAGRWELNVQDSDHVTGDEPGSRRGGDPGGGRGGRGGGGMGGRMGGRGGDGGGRGGERGEGASRESTAVQEEMRRVLEPERILIIVQHESSVSITDGDGRVVSLKPDGEKIKEEQGGGTIERTTKWDGRSLVTQVKLSNGTRATQTYTKVNEGLQLVVATKVEGGRFPRPLEFKRMYDQAFQ